MFLKKSIKLPRGASRCEKADSIGGKWGFLRRSFLREWERFAEKVGGSQKRECPSPYHCPPASRHFERSEKSSLHKSQAESVR